MGQKRPLRQDAPLWVGLPEVRPVVAVSACLAGEPVRYDGRTKGMSWVMEVLAKELTLEPVCPEVGVGMPVPRPPIELVAKAPAPQVRGVEDRHFNPTPRLQAFASQQSGWLKSNADGHILKSRSPSCGLMRVPVAAWAGPSPQKKVGWGQGVYAQGLQTHLPGFPLVEETRLVTALQREAFLVRVYAHARLRQVLEDGPSPQKLLELWQQYWLEGQLRAPRFYQTLRQVTDPQRFSAGFWSVMQQPVTQKGRQRVANLWLKGVAGPQVDSALSVSLAQWIHGKGLRQAVGSSSEALLQNHSRFHPLRFHFWCPFPANLLG